MQEIHDQRGATLVEAVVAASLLVTLATGTAWLILLAHRLGADAERSMAATSLAAARLHAVKAIPWEFGIDGTAPDVAPLQYSPADAIDRNTAGWWQPVDATGLAAGEDGAGAPTFAVRWALWPLAAGSAHARAIEVCVFPWPGAEGASPLACVASARTRQP